MKPSLNDSSCLGRIACRNATSSSCDRSPSLCRCHRTISAGLSCGVSPVCCWRGPVCSRGITWWIVSAGLTVSRTTCPCSESSPCCSGSGAPLSVGAVCSCTGLAGLYIHVGVSGPPGVSVRYVKFYHRMSIQTSTALSAHVLPFSPLNHPSPVCPSRGLARRPQTTAGKRQRVWEEMHAGTRRSGEVWAGVRAMSRGYG